jgi:hypothetical protein
MLYDFSRGALREHVLFPPGSDKHHGLPKDTHKEAINLYQNLAARNGDYKRKMVGGRMHLKKHAKAHEELAIEKAAAVAGDRLCDMCCWLSGKGKSATQKTSTQAPDEEQSRMYSASTTSPQQISVQDSGSPRAGQQSKPAAQYCTVTLPVCVLSRIGATQYVVPALYPTARAVSITAVTEKKIFPASWRASAGSEGKTLVYVAASS